MMRLQILGAAAALACVLASVPVSPAGAQQVVQYPGACKQFYPNANCTNDGPGSPYTGSYQFHRRYWNSRGADLAWFDPEWAYGYGPPPPYAPPPY